MLNIIFYFTTFKLTLKIQNIRNDKQSHLSSQNLDDCNNYNKHKMKVIRIYAFCNFNVSFILCLTSKKVTKAAKVMRALRVRYIMFFK